MVLVKEFRHLLHGFGQREYDNFVFGLDLRVAGGKDGLVAAELPEKSITFLTTDYQDRVPAPVKDVKVADGRLTWTPVDDPDHCYYRVYENGSQIASTVATSLPVKTDDVSSFTVKSVDKWGNEGR